MIDIGANLADRAFKADWREVVKRAGDAGVERIVATGSSVERSLESLALVRQLPGVLTMTAGIHPHHARETSDEGWAVLEKLWSEAEVVAVGECGLDFFRDLSPRDVQRAVFERHLEAAAGNGLPLFIHERDAGDAMIEIMSAWRDRLGRAVIHCFTNDADVLRRYLDLDLMIGITGWICHETRGIDLRETVKLIPDDRLMIETDAPYLYPMSLVPLPKSRRNEPAFLGAVRDTVAACRGQTPEHIDAITTANARAFFGLD